MVTRRVTYDYLDGQKLMTRCTGPAEVLDPAVDMTALGELQSDYTLPTVLNANGVQEYLRNQGAFYFGQMLFVWTSQLFHVGSCSQGYRIFPSRPLVC